MRIHGPVLVGTDFSEASDEALRQGYQFASALGTSLIVCHVVPDLETVNVLFPQLASRDADRQRLLADKALAALEHQAAATLGDAATNVKAVVEAGTAHAGLLTQADATGAGLIVLGPGRTADRVVRHATVPALIARQCPRGSVIGATDFSDPSFPALEAAASEARRRGSRLQLLHVVDLGTFAIAGAAGAGLPFLPGSMSLPLVALDDLRRAAQHKLGDELARVAMDGEAITKSGPAAQTIIDLADSAPAELVVVGTHGRTGLARLTLGSTAEAVIESAHCSVLVVRLTKSPR
jgi:nucleotide-binding universal stress UspA family protein